MTAKFMEPTQEHAGQIVQVSTYGESWSHRKLLAVLPSTQAERFVCEDSCNSGRFCSWKLARIPRQQTYAELQEESGLKVGDMVKVLRKGSKDELGWENIWIDYEMDKAIGQVCTIREITENGIKLDQCALYSFPYFILEKYKETKEEKIENLLREFAKKLKEVSDEQL